MYRKSTSILPTARERRLVRQRFRGRVGVWMETVSGYRAMWLVVCFDLPVGTPKERRDATRFRHRLLDEGFAMKQWSVYTRYFLTRAQAEAAADRIGGRVPPMGKVSIMFITDKQFGMVRNFEGRAPAETEKKPDQLALF